MATVAQIQAQLDPSGSGLVANIITQSHQTVTLDEFYVVGLTGAPGRSRYCTTTASDTAAQQATAILASLNA